MRNALMQKGLRYGLTAPVLTLALLLVSVFLFGTSSKEDVCSAYSDVASDLAFAYSTTDGFRDSHIETLAREATNYTDDPDIQQDGEDLEEAHGDTYTSYGIAAATYNIASLCGYSIDTD